MYKENLTNQIIDLYNNKKISTANIAKQLKIGITTVQRKLSNLKLLKSVSETKRKYTFNHNYFEKIDNEDKAYFLGLMYADGNISINKCIRLTSKDKYILEKLFECINHTGVIYREFHNKFKKECFKAQASSEKMFNDLNNLGCVPNKSLILKFPTNIPNDLVHHFIRGYFDGDGTVGIYNLKGSIWKRLTCGFCGTKEFLTDLNIKSGMKIKTLKKQKNIFRLTFSVEDSNELYKYMYKDATIFLTRKKDIFDNYIKQRSSTTTMNNPLKRKGWRIKV